MRYHPELGVSAPELGWVPAPRYLLRRNRILAGLPASGAGAALEIGCGAGALLKDLRLRGYECTALETSSSALSIARTIHADDPSVRILEYAKSDWGEEFDLGLACEVLEHIESDSEALADWVRWLRPGGRFILTVPGRPEKWDNSDVCAGHFRRYTRESLGALSLSVGLRLDRIECYGFPLVNCMAPIQSLRRRKAAADRSRDLKRDEATAASGIDRRFEIRLFPLLNNPFGRLMLRYGVAWQDRHLADDKGVALLAWTTKP